MSETYVTILELIEYLNTLDPNDKVKAYDRPDGSRIFTYKSGEGLDFYISKKADA